MLESSPDHIYFKDTESRFLRINRALAEYFGLNDPAEAVGKTDCDFHSPEKARVRFEDEQCIMKTGVPIIDKIERQSQTDGKTVWVLTSKSPLCDEKGNLIGTFGISRDVTLLKEMEDALWSERNVLRNVIDNVPDFIFAKGIDGRYTLSNLAHARFFGKDSPEEVLGKTLFDLMAPDAAATQQAIDKLLGCGCDFLMTYPAGYNPALDAYMRSIAHRGSDYRVMAWHRGPRGNDWRQVEFSEVTPAMETYMPGWAQTLVVLYRGPADIWSRPELRDNI